MTKVVVFSLCTNNTIYSFSTRGNQLIGPPWFNDISNLSPQL